MQKKYFLFVFCLSHFCFLTVGRADHEPSDLPNIILVMADDQGYGDAGYTGHPFLKTPNMDAMAQDGVVFNRFYAAAPVCSPTRASVLTGRNPNRGNVLNHGHYLRPQEITIAEALKKAGYVTGHFGKWHVGSVQPDSPTTPGSAGFDEWLSGLNFFDRDPFLSRNGRYEQLEGQGSVITMDAALDFLKRHQGGKQPIFLVIWFPAPHVPHLESLVPPGQASRYAGKTNQGYFDEIDVVDQQLGRLRTALRKMQMKQNTLLWYCSDNGGLLSESSGGRGKKGSIYEGGLRVPAILEWPAKWSHREVDVPATTSDIYPTLLAIAHVKMENQPPLDGIDLKNVISGDQSSRPPIGFWFGLANGQVTRSDQIIEKLLEAQRAGLPSPFPKRKEKNVKEFPTIHANTRLKGHAAWNDWPWKLHRIVNKRVVRYELYNLETDPMESKNRIKQEPERARKMRRELEAWQRSVLQSWAGKDY